MAVLLVLIVAARCLRVCFVLIRNEQKKNRFGQYLATTLSVCVNDDKNMTSDVGKLDDSSPAALVASRNEGLTLLVKLLLVHDKGVINLTCEIHG